MRYLTTRNVSGDSDTFFFIELIYYELIMWIGEMWVSPRTRGLEFCKTKFRVRLAASRGELEIKPWKNYGTMSHYQSYCFIVSLPTSFIPVDSWLFCLFCFTQKVGKIKLKFIIKCTKIFYISRDSNAIESTSHASSIDSAWTPAIFIHKLHIHPSYCAENTALTKF